MRDPFEWEYFLMLALIAIAGSVASAAFSFFWYEVLR